jgi:hypothetical protein
MFGRRSWLVIVAGCLAPLAAACAGGGDDDDEGALAPPWALVPAPTKADLNDGFVSGDEGWACGAGGTLLRSADGGASWAAVAVPTSADLRRVGSLFGGQPARDYRFAVGDGGAIVLSKDGGATWALKHSGAESLVAVGAFLGEKTVFAAAGNDGDDVVLLTSGDEFETWQRTVVASGVRARDAYFSFDEAYVAGDHGLLLRTADRGATWASVPVEPAADLRRITGLGPNFWGDGVIVAHTRDGLFEGWTISYRTDRPNFADEDSGVAIGTGRDGKAVLARLADVDRDPTAFTVESLGWRVDLRAVSRVEGGVLAFGAGGTIVRRSLP